jgi:hypothetical protein
LQDRGLRGVSFDCPITSIAERRLDSMMIAHGADRFATQIDVGADRSMLIALPRCPEVGGI